MSAAPAPEAPPRALRDDARTIGLVGLAHGASHFHHMLLPPLFPWLMQAFGFSFAEAGVLVSIFFIVSGIGQALAGFLVDRVGARPVLFGAVGCFIAASCAAGLADSYAGLGLAAALAGLGNAPFHPVDFTILNRRVSPARLGHGYSVHGISGNLGWALAPVLLAGVTAATGNWRLAYVASGALAAVVLAVLWLGRAWLDDRAIVGAGPAAQGASAARRAAEEAAPPSEHALAFLRLPAVWLCFGFFFWTTVSLAGIQSFASSALQALYGLPAAWTSLTLTGYMLCSAAGMVAGGFIVARADRLERVIAGGLAVAAALLLLVASGAIPGMLALTLVSLAGAGSGLAGPSRDMLIRRAAPPGATGRVYGTVYSGLDLGFAVASPALGWMMDRGHASGIFVACAAALVAGIASASLVGIGVAARRRLAAAGGAG